MRKETILVIGARDASLGDEIVSECRRRHGSLNVIGAGLGGGRYEAGNEAIFLDVRQPKSILEAITTFRPDHIVCTAGVASSKSVGEDGFRRDFEEAFTVNVFGVIDVLNIWLQYLAAEKADEKRTRHFVGISSNSAHVARTASAGYCASKAALSMALRVAGREQARAATGVRVYGYEPGLLAGTPMTRATREMLGPIAPMTRMPGLPVGMPVKPLAKLIVDNLTTDGLMLNGCMLRLDAGEQ